MTLKEAQKSVRHFVTKHDMVCEPVTVTLDLVSELGEIAKELCHSTSYGKHEVVLRVQFAEELGDVQFALMNLANSANVDLGDALQGTIAKMEERIKRHGHPGSGT